MAYSRGVAVGLVVICGFIVTVFSPRSSTEGSHAGRRASRPEFRPIRIGIHVSIYQRKSVWYANYQLQGRQVRKSLGTSKLKEARLRASRIENELTVGGDPGRPEPAKVSVVAQEYLSSLETEQRALKTLVKYRHVLGRVQTLAQDLGRGQVDRLDLAFLDRYKKTRVSEGAAPKTLYTECTIIRQLVNFALTRRMIGDDPLRGLKLKKPKPTEQPCWTTQQVETILDAAASELRPIFTILARTGMRIGELKFLTWADVDFKKQVIHIRPKDGGQPKNRDRRRLPMDPRVDAVLKALPRKGKWVVTAGRSSKHPRGDGQVDERRLLRSLKRLLVRVGLKGHLHTFRHSFISAALISGVPEAIVREWVGHVDPEVIRQYTHIADEVSQTAMGKLAGTNPGSAVSTNSAHVTEEASNQ